jgi:hypothetical protein
MSSTNQPKADDHAPMGPPSAEVIARGYEADAYDAKSVLSVPLLVLLFFVLAFGTVTIIFSFIAYPKGGVNPKAHPAAAEQNKAPLNERLNRIGRGHEVDQPRLEPLKLRSGDARAIPRPELSVAEGNSPELHPEDLIPTKERFPSLYATGDGKYGLDKTMSLDDKALALLFPVQKTGTKPANSQHVPTAANAGRGADESLVVIPGTPNIPAPGPTPAPPPNPKGGKQ